MPGQQGMGEYYVDIVMCIDATGSMSPIIEEVKANALSLYQKFVDEMEALDTPKDVEQLRIKVIAFRDYGCDTEPMVESPFYVLPAQNDEFRSFIASIKATGGGDGPENALEAIALALKSDWTPAMQGIKRRHVVLVFTDAPALSLGARASAASYPAGMPRDLAQLGAWWEKTDQEFVSEYDVNAGRLVAFAPNCEPWTDMQGWRRYWPAFSKAGTGLEEVDIQNVLDLLVGSIG